MRQDSGGTKCIAMGRVVWVRAGEELEASMAVEESRVENAMIIFCFHLNIVSVVGAHGEGGVGGGREGVSPRPPHHLRHRLQLRPRLQPASFSTTRVQRLRSHFYLATPCPTG